MNHLPATPYASASGSDDYRPKSSLPSRDKTIPHQENDVAVVATILEQVPGLTKIQRVLRRGGEVVNFEPAKIAASLSAVCLAVGIKDELLLARATQQVLMRLEREFDGHTTPTTDDISRVVAVVLIDNNLPFAVKKYFELHADTMKPPKVISRGLHFTRKFSQANVHPYNEIEWELRDAIITNEKGKVVFEQKAVEVPKNWTQSATNIVVSKYFRGEIGQVERETSVKQMVGRVADTITDWGDQGGYFGSVVDRETYRAELTAILVNQMAAFNSPVWFNVGVVARPQCSACFINSVRDDMRSILNLAVTEGMLFKGGSGTGSNLSTLRSAKEKLAHSSGYSSGVVSFMKGYDAFAGVIKSGGKTRRAAKMVILNADHPDIEDFITCKVREERKAKALVAAGYDSSIDGEAYHSIFFQNANNSVRVTDEFMEAVLADRNWQTKAVTTGAVMDTYRARDLMNKISEAAWECGDPGMQYDSTVNRWNPVTNSGRINSSNPCSEYMFLDDTACNLASLNLMKFRDANGEFDVESFKHAVDVIITAQEITVDFSSYPTPAIEENSYSYRPLGMGYANLGALLMSRGLAYDSDEGRNFAAAITALMSGEAYHQSAQIAEVLGAFRYYKFNEQPFLKVIGQHRDAAYKINPAGVPQNLVSAAKRSWDQALEAGMAHGFKNAQISVLAPTGTIGFLMDCDTTGVEPDIALIKYKWLVGGGLMKIVNHTVPLALKRLGYNDNESKNILEYIDKNDTIEGAPSLKPEHLAVFDCAFKAAKGTRSIHYMGHIRMMSAVQPFISGAISKTVNLPNAATPDDITQAYIEGWRLGLKAIAIYRDGSKGQQVLTTSAEKNSDQVDPKLTTAESKSMNREPVELPKSPATTQPLRHRLADERRSLTHKFSVGNHEGYITVGLYDDGTPGEIFIRMAKGGSVISGLMDSFATATSIALQYGVPLRILVNKFVHVRFEPAGFTTHPNIRMAKSIVDYIFRWLALKFLSVSDQKNLGLNDLADILADEAVTETLVTPELTDPTGVKMEQMSITATVPTINKSQFSNSLTMSFDVQSDAPACDTCGAIMIRSAACYKCLNCGNTSGCS